MDKPASDSWNVILQEMLHETNRTRLRLLAMELEESIFEHHMAIDTHNMPAPEQERLTEAVDELYNVQVRKLGFSDSRLNSKTAVS